MTPAPLTAIAAIEKAMADLRHAPGPWEVESEKQDDLSPQHDEFALHNADGYRMCGTENADWRFSEIVTDGPDEDGFFCDWNDQAERLMKYIAACNPFAMREILAAARKAEALQRENAELREALEPFVTDWADEHGWTETACQKDRIVDWFGPSDFRRARTLLKDSADAKGQADV